MAVFVEVLGSAAAVLTTGAFVPQVLQTVRTRSAKDFSYGWLVCFLTGLVCWLIYGFLIWSWPIIVSNITTQAFVITILVIKLGVVRRSANHADSAS